MHRVAVVGAGVVGLSSALAIKEAHPSINVTIISDRPFEETCSYGPAGLFRIDNPKYRDLGRASFVRFAELNKRFPGSETGIKLLSGTIMSNDRALLETQEEAYGDTVLNFRWLTDAERTMLFPKPADHAIFFTTFASEGVRYVPFLRRQLEELEGVTFENRRLEALDELADSFDVVVNCSGIDGGKLAGDDDTVFPVRGIAIQIEAPWHKHFYYQNLDTFTIPMNGAVTLGSVKQTNRTDTTITDEDRRDIWERYLEIHPQMEGAKVLREWIALRPGRKEVRLEAQQRQTAAGEQYTVIHNYGHGGNGFTLGWGCAQEVLQLLEKELGLSKL